MHQHNNKQNSIITNLKKNDDSILKNNIYINFPKRINERKGTEAFGNSYKNIIKKIKNSSFSNKKRKENYILNNDEESLSDEIDNKLIKENDDLLNSMDYNSISMNNNNTRKLTIEMEYINKNEKN